MLSAKDQAKLMSRLMETPGTGQPNSSPQWSHGPKFPRNDHQAGSWGNRRSKGGWGTGSWWPYQEQEETGASKTAEVVELCYTMAQPVLRHEDQHNINRIESGFVLFCQTKGMLSMVPNMHKATTVWQKAKAENPQNLTLTLRSKLLQRFTTVWLQCLDACLVTEESKKQAAAIVILNDPQCGRHSSVLAIQQGKEKFFRCGFARKKQIAAGNTVPDWLTQECAEQ